MFIEHQISIKRDFFFRKSDPKPLNDSVHKAVELVSFLSSIFYFPSLK